MGKLIRVPNLIDIVAVGRNGEMGLKGELPWRGMYKDVGRFVERTLADPVLLMGDVTFLSIPENRRPLHDRAHYVLSFNPSNSELQRYGDRVNICGSIPEAFEKINRDHFGERVLNVGGKAVFDCCMKYTSGIYLTTLDIVSPEADRCFEFDRSEWDQESLETWVEENGTVCVDEFLVRKDKEQVPRYIFRK